MSGWKDDFAVTMRWIVNTETEARAVRDHVMEWLPAWRKARATPVPAPQARRPRPDWRVINGGAK